MNAQGQKTYSGTYNDSYYRALSVPKATYTYKNTKVSRSLDTDLDNETLRLVKSMPKWNPGKQNGIEVRVRYSVPVNFRLQ